LAFLLCVYAHRVLLIAFLYTVYLHDALPISPHLKKYHELKKACELVIESGADFVKEATGFAAGYDGTGVASYSDDEVDSFDNTGIETIKHIYDIVEIGRAHV